MKDENIPYMRPVFRGARFDGHAVPVEVLEELITYRDLVVQLAHQLFLDNTPGRKRVPKGFVESFQIVLSGIGEGSAVPQVDRVPVQIHGMRPLFHAPDYFEQARDLIDDVIASAAKREPLPKAFPTKLLPYFQKLGHSLRSGETIEFNAPGQQSGARFDHTIRRRLMLHEKPTIEDDFDEVGEIVGGHKDRGMLFVRLDDGHEIEVPRGTTEVQKLLALSGRRVHVVGVGSFSQDERLTRVIEVKELDVVDAEQLEAGAPSDEVAPLKQEVGPSPIDTQIDDLLALEPGWYDADTPALDKDGLERLRRFLHALVEGFVLPRPYLYPTPEAGARAEWTLSGWDVSATFDIRSDWADLHAAELDGEGLEEERVLLGDPLAVETVRAFLGRFNSKRGT